ncbi:MAG: Ig-like domain-containing protein, partial [Anaerolineales bacterium]|nr:Ig-like domain-containing protein [Anaerolineales bacterium]
MSRRFPVLSSLFVLFSLVLVACQQQPSGPTAVPPAPTMIAAQPTATATATTTATPQPTAEPTITPSPTAVPDILSAFLDADQNWDDFPIDGSLTLHFNQPMNPESSAVALRFTPHIAGEYVWSDDNTAVTFTPRDPLINDTRYEVTIARQLKSADGKFFTAIEAPRWFLHTDTPPQVARFE